MYCRSKCPRSVISCFFFPLFSKSMELRKKGNKRKPWARKKQKTKIVRKIKTNCDQWALDTMDIVKIWFHPSQDDQTIVLSLLITKSWLMGVLSKIRKNKNCSHNICCAFIIEEYGAVISEWSCSLIKYLRFESWVWKKSD